MKPKSIFRKAIVCGFCAMFWGASGGPLAARDIYVAVTGDDAADGSAAKPLRTIQAAAKQAMPGDVITVREGIYRERIDPPRGGQPDAKRIVFQAAPGEKVAIKGWVIENNMIRYSVCSGVTLGKHGDEFDNKSANSAVGYVETIKRGIAAGWSKENIGHHQVRNNHISHCEQTGICGSLGPAFSTISGNEIHDIHIRQLFSGAEMAGIKFHGAIDTVISDNHIYRAGRGIWLDWMTQGTRVTRNLIHDIAPREDLFVEVNHGPFLVYHNVFLSPTTLLDVSQGGAYAHNVFAGRIKNSPELKRDTPWQEEHGTRIAGLSTTKGGDNRFYNNIFTGPAGLVGYDNSALPNMMAGNVFLNGAEPSKHEKSPQVRPDFDPAVKLREDGGRWLLDFDLNWGGITAGPLVTSELLGKALIPNQAFVQADGSPYRLDRDFIGATRSKSNPSPGPFQGRPVNKQSIKLWPPQGRDSNCK